VRIVATAADVREEERHGWMARRQPREIGAIARILTCDVPAAMLPDVMQHGQAERGRAVADRIEQPVARAACGGELDADCAERHAAVDLAEREGGVVRVHGDVATDQVGMLALQLQHLVVAAAGVGR
jgi:hypothetical protein